MSAGGPDRLPTGPERVRARPACIVPNQQSTVKRGFAMKDYMDNLRERWSDALLTALTGLLVVMLFVIAPLQALGIFIFQAFELLFAIILVAGVFVMSGSRIAFAAMLVSLLMATIGAISRIKAPSIVDINLFAGSWLIMGITLGVVCVARCVCPGTRHVAPRHGSCLALSGDRHHLCGTLYIHGVARTQGIFRIVAGR